MPSNLGDRLRHISTLHNLLASARSSGEPGVPAAKILSEMGCERTTLYRCRRELQAMGAPIRYAPKSNLWRYEEDWNCSWSWCRTLTGTAGLRLSLSFLLDPDLERDLAECVLPARGAKGSPATLPRFTGVVDRAVLPPISQALRESREISFFYAKPGGNPEPRRVRPLSLFTWDGMPYLQAAAADDPEARIKRYALSRISRVRVQSETFKPIPLRDTPSCLGAFNGPVIVARFRARSDLAPYVRERRWHPEQKNTEGPDGSLEFTLPFGDVDEAARWILGRGPGFAPVAPTPLVRAWKEMARQLGAR